MIGFLPVGRGPVSGARHAGFPRGRQRDARPDAPSYLLSCIGPRQRRLLVGAASVFLYTACAGNPGEGRPGRGLDSPVRPIAEEVRLTTISGGATGKITGLSGQEITFLPAPYWGVEPRAIPLRDIRTISVEREGQAAKGFVYTSATVFTLVGLLGGAAAEYDTDYSFALSAAVVTGVGAGLLGALLGLASRTKTYPFHEFSSWRQHQLIWELMGFDESPAALEDTWTDAEAWP